MSVILDRLRAKYPAYNAVPDDELAEALVNKYPEYKEQFQVEPNRIVAPRQPGHTVSTTAGGPRVPVASLKETMAEPVEAMTTPRVTTPKFTINKDDNPAVAVGKEAVNIASSIPEFFSSDMGVMSVAAGAAAPVATATAFTADMLKSAGEQIVQTHKNWDQMSKGQDSWRC